MRLGRPAESEFTDSLPHTLNRCSYTVIAMKKELTQEFLKQALAYDPKTGDFVWAQRPESHFSSSGRARHWNETYAGRKAGCVVTIHDGRYQYEQIGLKFLGKSRLYKAHRLAWLYVNGEWPKYGIDHIDGDSLNNAIANLRDVPQAVNCKNQRRSSQNTSGYPGVSWNSRDKAWVAFVTIDGKLKSLGYYSDPEEAAEVASNARLRLGYTARHVI